MQVVQLILKVEHRSCSWLRRRDRYKHVEEDMDHPLIGRPVLDGMGFVASQHLDSGRDKFHLHGFSRIGDELLDIGKQPLGAPSNLLLKPADIPEFIEDLPVC
jgi:hypothetical protein